mgnify:CR=1 FL=1
MNMFILSVGDSGGPLLIPDGPQGNITAGLPENDLIVGITSFGVGSCDDSAPGVYTGVSYMSDWILGIVDEEEDEVSLVASFVDWVVASFVFTLSTCF